VIFWYQASLQFEGGALVCLAGFHALGGKIARGNGFFSSAPAFPRYKKKGFNRSLLKVKLPETTSPGLFNIAASPDKEHAA